MAVPVQATRTQRIPPLVTYKSCSNSDESFILRNDRIGRIDLPLFYRNILKTENVVLYVFKKTVFQQRMTTRDFDTEE